ncbi:unnamed protein product [Closterium sp. Naga37s-1]|nr:unnamed protein product [Closterium sp. Naga37s-1]
MRSEVSMNRITGQIPPGIATLSNLTSLAVSYNQMSGALLPGLGNLRQLRTLNLQKLNLGGAVPAAWAGMVPNKLVRLLLGSSSHPSCSPFPFPPPLDSNLQKLNLGGAVPAAWAGMVSLKHFVASATRMRGRFPSVLLKLPRIEDIVLYNNFLWGQLPPAAQLFAPKALTHLDVSGNYLSGAVPKVPAGRQIEFRFSSNCFLPKPGPKCKRS